MTETEIIVIVGLAILITLIAVLIIIMIKRPQTLNDESKGRNQQELISKIENLENKFKVEIDKQNIQSKLDIERTFNQFREVVSSKLNTDLQQMNEKVEHRLKEGFQSSDKLFNTMVEKLAIIDTTQKNIESLSGHVTDLKTYLSDKKSRGMYGEVQLYQILNNVFGEKNETLFSKQYKLSNGSIVDAMVFGMQKTLNVPIDSKFSLENYIRMYDDNITDQERKQASKLFEQNIKKHVDDISSKYIILNETTDYALMFIPSEAVFSEIQANYMHLVTYAQLKKVWITSPTTLVYMLTMILIIHKDLEKEKHAENMLLELTKLFNDYRLFFERWAKFKEDVQRLVKSIDSLDKPMNRLNKNVYKIESSDFDNINIDD
jgi:DNA recombination protein RmuC